MAILAAVLIVLGLAGIFLPVLPSVLLAWLGLFLYALSTGFEEISVWAIVILFVLTGLTLVLDVVAPLIGAKEYKASTYGLLGVALGLVLGIFVFGPFGIILGPFIGAFAGELIAKRSHDRALRVALGTTLGFLASSLLKVIVVLIIAGFFIAALV